MQTILSFEEKNIRPWVRPAWLAAIVGMLLMSWYLARFDPTKNPLSFPAAIGIILPLSIFLVYVVPMLTRLFHSEVFIHTNSIARSQGNVNTWLSLKKINSYYWVSHGNFYTLAIMTNHKQPTLFGVPDAETKQKIEHALESLGIPQSSAEPEDRTDAAGDSGGREE